MNWSDERYVRLYTRWTADRLAIGPEGRLVWYELLQAADRSGIVDNGGDLDVLAELLRVPREMFEVGWRRIVARGMVVVGPTSVVIPNYIDANETPRSDAQRQREARARRRDRTRSDADASRNVTRASQNVSSVISTVAGNGVHAISGAEIQEGNAAKKAIAGTDTSRIVTEDVTNRDLNVTRGHAESHGVTACHSVPCRDLSGAVAPEPPALESSTVPILASPLEQESNAQAQAGVRVNARDAREGGDAVPEAVAAERTEPGLLPVRAVSAEAAAPKRTPRRKPETPMPPDWRPTAAHEALAAELGVNVRSQEVAFRAWVESVDRRYRSWDAGFETWLRRAQDFAPRRPGLAVLSGGVRDQAAELLAEAKRLREEGR